MMRRQWLDGILRGALLLLAILAAGKLAVHVLYELRGGFHSDAAIYLTVARGWLHGLTPYIDLFENKAPGVFLLAATSLKLFDDWRLLTWVQGLALALLPFCFIFPVVVWDRFKKASLPLLLLAFSVGCALALYSGVMAGQLLPESWGVLFACAFLAVIATYADAAPRWIWVALGLLLLVAVGIKEPFLLSIIGGMCVLLPLRRGVKQFLPALGCAAVIGIAGLFVFGLLVPYFTVHLAHMFGYHVFHPWGTLDEPLWLRSIDIFRLAKNLAAVSLGLPVLAAALWIGALGVMLKIAKSSRERWGAVGRWVLGSWLNTTAVGLTGDFYGHHFVFAVPLLAACTFVLMRWLHAYRTSTEASVGLGIGAIAVAVALLGTAPDYAGMNTQWDEWSTPRAKAGETLDLIMDRCGFDKYFVYIDRPDGVYGFSRSIPYGPIFTQYGRFIGAVPVYVEGFAQAMQNARILLMRSDEEVVPTDEKVQAYMRHEFLEIPWPCAGTFTQPLPYRILFRRFVLSNTK